MKYIGTGVKYVITFNNSSGIEQNCTSVCCFLISACGKGQTLSSDEVIKGTNPYFLFRENVIIVNFSPPIKYPEKQFKRPLQPHQTRPTGKGKLKLPDIKA